MAVLLAALVAGAVPATEASIPPAESWPSLVEEPAASVLEPPSLEDLAAALAAPATSPDAEAAGGETLRLFEGLELGLAARSEPRFRLYPRLETRVRAITLPEPLHIELELPLTPSRFRLYGDPRPRIAVGGTFLTTDPLGYVDGPNLYQYGLNNPINFSDPMGLQVGQGLAEQWAMEQYLERLPPEQREEARRQLRQGRAEVDSWGVSLFPGASDVYDGAQVVFAVDPITGEPLTPEDQVWATIGMGTPLLGGKLIRLFADTPAGRWTLQKGRESYEFVGERWRVFRRRISLPEPTGDVPANPIPHQKYLDELRAAMERPPTNDAELSRIMDELYRPGAKEGSGSTAAAVRSERATGNPIGGRFHAQKAQEAVTRLERWLARNPTAASGDRAAAENVLRDLQNALE